MREVEVMGGVRQCRRVTGLCRQVLRKALNFVSGPTPWWVVVMVMPRLPRATSSPGRERGSSRAQLRATAALQAAQNLPPVPAHPARAASAWRRGPGPHLLGQHGQQGGGPRTALATAITPVPHHRLL